MTEIEKFYKSFKLEIETIQLSSEDGDTQEQAFTRKCIDSLSFAHETENAVLAYDEKGLGTKNQHKINGYAITDNNDTIDLFISIFYPSEEIETLEKLQIDRAAIRISNFFSKAYYNNYEMELAETSPVFEFAHQLAQSQEIRKNLIRINAYILTNRRYTGETPEPIEINNYKMYFTIVDIDKLYSISEQSRLPIQLDLAENKVTVPCLPINVNSDKYTAYLATLPGDFLSSLYEQYGFKLLEQNVRSFLQFKGNINRGIKRTILENPKMFFAYNNGISATAESIDLDPEGRYITRINNLQIVNGGQTTAALYHVSKEAKGQLSEVLVPVKISVISDKDNAYEIIKSISTCANTQNRVNEADLIANHPVLVEIEKVSRYMLTPVSSQSLVQHYWFFDRIKKQYDNLLTENSKLKSKKKAFLMKYPKQCKFNTYQMCKFHNSYCEIEDNGRIVLGPHTVVDGNEPNFRAFRDHILSELDVDTTFYEDLIAKAILFLEVDRRHGTKRGKKSEPLGDMKQLVVPYSIGLLKIATKDCLNLEKIWKNQCLSDELSDYMYNLMKALYPFFKENSPKSNIIEWGTKEECWQFVKENFEIPSIESIKDDICDPADIAIRYQKSESESDEELKECEEKLVQEIGHEMWQSISSWGRDSGCMELADQNAAANIAHKLRYGYAMNRREIKRAISLYEIVCLNNYDIFQVEQECDQTNFDLLKFSI